MVPNGDEVNPDGQAGVIEDRRKGRCYADFKIGNARDFRHHEGACPHDRRHVLSAAGGDRLDRARELGAVTQPFHHGNGKGSGSIYVGRGHAADRTEEGAADHRNLGRPPLALARQPAGKVREELAGLSALHEGPENDKQGHEGGRNAGDGTINAGVRQQKLHLDNLRQGQRLAVENTREIGSQLEVDEKTSDQHGHGRNHCPPDPLEEEDDVQRSKNEFQGGERIDKLQTRVKGVVAKNQVNRGNQCQEGQEPVV